VAPLHHLAITGHHQWLLVIEVSLTNTASGKHLRIARQPQSEPQSPSSGVRGGEAAWHVRFFFALWCVSLHLAHHQKDA
jgi:hypothetical protein